MALEISVAHTPQGEMPTVRDSETGRISNVIVSTAELNRFHEAMVFNAALVSFANKAHDYASKFIGDEFHARIRVEAKPPTNAMRNYRQAASELKVQTQAKLDEFGPVPAYDSFIEAQIRSDIRAILRHSKPGEVASVIEKADHRIIAGICEAPSIVSGLNDDLYLLARERLIFQNITREYGLIANNKKSASLDDLLASGVDTAAVDEMAKAVLNDQQKKLEDCKLAELTIRRAITFIATICNLKDQEIFDEIA